MVRRLLNPALVAVLLRLVVVLLAAPDQQRVFNSDSYEYELLGKNLLVTGELSRDREPPFTPEATRTPLFPALIAGLLALGGPGYLGVLLVNAALAGLAAGALLRAHPDLGRPAAWLYALDPTSIVYASLYVAETLLAVLLLASLLLLARALEAGERGARRLSLLAGLAGGLAVLAKPVATYLPAALLGGALVARRRKLGFAWIAGLYLAGYGLTVGPWVVRNQRALGVAGTSRIQEVNLLYWNVAVLEGTRSGLDYRSAEQALRAEVEARLAARPGAGPAEEARLLRSMALERIVAHPLTYAWVHARGALATLLDPGRLDYARLLGGVDWSFGFLSVLTEHGIAGVLRTLAGRPPLLIGLLALTGLWLLALHVLALRGLVGRARELPGEPLLLLALCMLGYLALVGGPIGNARFRVPLVPCLALMAAAGLERHGGSAGEAGARG